METDIASSRIGGFVDDFGDLSARQRAESTGSSSLKEEGSGMWGVFVLIVSQISIFKIKCQDYGQRNNL
jgi:hypothetical protein